VQDGQHRSIGPWIEQLGGLPCGGQGAGFRLAVADDAGDDQSRIVEGRPEGMTEGIAKFTAFVDRARGGRGNVAGYSARKRELGEQFFQPGFILGDVRINIA